MVQRTDYAIPKKPAAVPSPERFSVGCLALV